MSTKATVIYHRADFDGLFSAAVCRKFLPDSEFIGWDFGDPLIPFPGEGMLYIVDLSPDCLSDSPDCLSDAMVAVAAHHDRLVWIDHHKSSIDKWNPTIPGYRIDGVAACRLAWQWFNIDRWDGPAPDCPSELPGKRDYLDRMVSEPLALTLAGEYDVWDHRDPRAVPFQFGLKAALLGTTSDIERIDILKDYIQPSLAYDEELLTRNTVREGLAAYKWQQSLAGDVLLDQGRIIYIGDLRCLALFSAHARGSLWFPENVVRLMGGDNYPIEALAALRISYNGKVSVSLYHAPGYEHLDLAELVAKPNGGGGHRGACGFEVPLCEALEAGLIE